MPSNRAVFLDAPGRPLYIAEAPMPSPGANEIIIKNHAVAINPIDAKRWAAKGVLFPDTFPLVLGSDVSGEVYATGSDVSNFQKGDRVVGYGWGILTKQVADAAYQLYTRVPAQNAAILPDNISFQEAAVLPMGLTTASCGLFEPEHLALPKPFETSSAADKTIIVYGASSSVGVNAVQLAAASGVHVIAVSSKHNFDLMKEAGAKEIYDYNSPTAVSDIASSILSSSNNYVGIFDAIGSESSFQIVVPLVEKLGGRYVTSTGTPKNIPKGTQATRVSGFGDYSFPLWTQFVSQALMDGRLKPLPRPEIVGKGLEAFNPAVQKMLQGVSGKKLVVDLE